MGHNYQLLQLINYYWASNSKKRKYLLTSGGVNVDFKTPFRCDNANNCNTNHFFALTKFLKIKKWAKACNSIISKYLTSGGVDVDFKSPFGCDNAIIVIIVQIHDVITVGMIQAKFAKCDWYLKNKFSILFLWFLFAWISCVINYLKFWPKFNILQGNFFLWEDIMPSRQKTGIILKVSKMSIIKVVLLS